MQGIGFSLPIMKWCLFILLLFKSTSLATSSRTTICIGDSCVIRHSSSKRSSLQSNGTTSQNRFSRGPSSQFKTLRGGAVPVTQPLKNEEMNSMGTNEIGDNAPTPLPRRPKLFNMRFMEFFFRRLLSFLIRDPDLLRIIAKGLHYIFWSTIFLSGIGTMGIDTKPILSLISVSLVTLGFAAKDIINTLLAGVVLLITRPFARGMVISVNGHKGKVMEINLKYVRLQNIKDKAEILLPVSLVYNAPIVIEAADPKSNK